MLLMRPLVPLAAFTCLAACLAACGDGDGTSTTSGGGTGGASASSGLTSSGSAIASSASSSNTSTGAGAGNPDDPYGCLQGDTPTRPESIPEGYLPYTCWSEKPQCMLWIPQDPETQVEPLEWEPCGEGAPGGDGCQQMKRPWWTGEGYGAIGDTFPGVPELDNGGVEPLLRLLRISVDGTDASYIEFVVGEPDGAIRYSMRKPWSEDDECGYQDYDLTDGVWVMAPNGDDTVPIEESPLDGAIVVDIATKEVSLPYRANDPSTPGWRAGAQGFLRRTSPALYLHDRAFTSETLLHSAATDPIGAISSTARHLIGDSAIWEVYTSTTIGIRAYDPERGPHDLIRFLDEPTRGAGTPGTDGVDLVWMEGEDYQPDLYTYATRSIMTSPFTTDPAALKPRRLRRNLSTSFGTASEAFRVGCGRAAKSGGVSTKDIQIVRLSDGQGWNLLHTQQLWHASTVVGMTCDEIFLVVQIWEGEGGEPNGSTIQRIRFDALGEGLPPD